MIRVICASNVRRRRCQVKCELLIQTLGLALEASVYRASNVPRPVGESGSATGNAAARQVMPSSELNSGDGPAQLKYFRKSV